MNEKCNTKHSEPFISMQLFEDGWPIVSSSISSSKIPMLRFLLDFNKILRNASRFDKNFQQLRDQSNLSAKNVSNKRKTRWLLWKQWYMSIWQTTFYASKLDVIVSWILKFNVLKPFFNWIIPNYSKCCCVFISFWTRNSSLKLE